MCMRTRELNVEVGVDKDDVMELKVAWYGLQDGPVEFYETLSDELAKLGLTKSRLDPCICFSVNTVS